MAEKIILENNLMISEEGPVFVIAEIGQNHQGDITLAKKLIQVAKDCGADCVKFQKTCLEEKFTQSALKRQYINDNSWGKTYGEHKQYLEFSEEEFKELQRFSKDIGILFTASAMDLSSLKFLGSIGVPFIKIGSGDADNFILMEEAAKMEIPLVISTGMQSLETVEKIYEIVSRYHKKFVLMHCISSYPTQPSDLNLAMIQLLKDKFPDIHIGYSGHELGTDITATAVALGAKVIERHITLDHSLKGSDHGCSLEPDELSDLVRKIRNVQLALGKPIKIRRECEMPCYMKLGKTIVASRELKLGHVLGNEDVKIKVAEPRGMEACLVYSVFGKRLLKDVFLDEPILENILE